MRRVRFPGALPKMLVVGASRNSYNRGVASFLSRILGTRRFPLQHPT